MSNGTRARPLSRIQANWPASGPPILARNAPKATPASRRRNRDRGDHHLRQRRRGRSAARTPFHLAPGFLTPRRPRWSRAHEAAYRGFQTTTRRRPLLPRMPTGMPRKLLKPQSIPPRTRRRQSGNAPGAGRVGGGSDRVGVGGTVILSTVLLTRGKHSKMSQEDQVRQAIQSLTRHPDRRPDRCVP